MKRSISSSRIKFFLPLAASLLVAVFPGELSAATIEVIPADPTDQDNIVLRIQGSRTDGCWEYTGILCSPLVSRTIYIHVYWVDHWEPEFGCVSVMIEYDEQCEIGVLGPGEYIVTVVEHNDLSLRLPEIMTYSSGFNVDSVVSSSGCSWGRIKTIHR